MTGIDKAIKQAGTQTALAEMLGVTQQAISKWQSRGWVPLVRARQIASSFAIQLKELVDPDTAELME